MKEIDVAAIRPHPKNPRKDLGDLTELTDSIKAFGVLQNLTVVPDGTEEYTVICGHRRLAAAEAAGLKTVPCIVADNMDEKTQVSIMLLENMQRSDLTAQEEAQGLQMMLDLGSSISEIVKETGLSETKVRHRIKMNELDQNLLGKKITEQISINDIIKLEQLKDVAKRNELLADIGTNNFEWRLKEAIRTEKKNDTLELIKKYKPDVNVAPGYSWQYEKVGGMLSFGASQNEVAEFMIAFGGYEEERGEEALLLEQSEGFHIGVERNHTQSTKEDPEEAKARMNKQKRIQSLTEMKKRVTKSWEEFLKAYCSKSESYIVRDQTVILNYLIAGSIESWADFDDLRETLGIDPDLDDEEALRTMKERPWATLTAMAYCEIVPPSYSTTWSYKDETYDTKAAGSWIETSGYLELLGYDVSDEEAAFINGTSDLYGKKEG